MLTAPQLFAQARSVSLALGDSRCFFCGGSCDETFTAKQYVAESFTERNDVACPGSRHVCGGCVEALRSDLVSVPLLDGGEQRPKADAKRAGMQVRWYSWVVTSESARAATPAHRDKILSLCLTPPAPPFAICIADGNKHQLFRTPVNLSPGRVTLNCEGRRVDYHPDDLRDRLHLVMRLIAVCGKGGDALTRLADPHQAMSVVLQLGRVYDDAAELYEAWMQVQNEPLTDLALWLSPGKAELDARSRNGSGEDATAFGAV